MKPIRQLTPAVFLDKDGTLVEDVPYNADPRLLKWYPGVFEGLARLQAHGYRLVVITNQPGVALGRFREEAVGILEAEMRSRMQKSGVLLDGFYYCPHHPEGTVLEYRAVCRCRKPAGGLLERAARALSIDLRQSWMVGDILNDVEAGRRAGCRTILVNTGGETEWWLTQGRRPHFVTSSVQAAAECILRHQKSPMTNVERHCA